MVSKQNLLAIVLVGVLLAGALPNYARADLLSGILPLVTSIVSDQFFNGILSLAGPTCPGKSFYNRPAFLDGLVPFPDAFCSSCLDPLELNRQLACFFAVFDSQTQQLCLIDEIGGATKDYCDEKITQYPCVPGKSYHGRGPFQLRGNFLYGAAGEAIGFDLLKYPEVVATDVVLSFKIAIWFWVENLKLVITSEGFGAVIRIIDPLICDGKNPNAVKAYVDTYLHYCGLLGATPGDNLYC